MPDVGPKKNLAETGHPKMAKILGPPAKKITLFDTKNNKKKGQQVLLASHFFLLALFSLVYLMIYGFIFCILLILCPK